jgi:hypothetical protein
MQATPEETPHFVRMRSCTCSVGMRAFSSPRPRKILDTRAPLTRGFVSLRRFRRGPALGSSIRIRNPMTVRSRNLSRGQCYGAKEWSVAELFHQHNLSSFIRVGSAGTRYERRRKPLITTLRPLSSPTPTNWRPAWTRRAGHLSTSLGRALNALAFSRALQGKPEDLIA